MYLLTNNNNVIIYISTEAVLKADGIHVGSNQVFSDKSLNIIDITSIPSDIIPQKYCYSEQHGFYLNESYQQVTNSDNTEKINYILNKIEPIVDENRLTLEELKDLYVARSNALCDKTIDAGTDVELSDGIEHFSLTIKDQKNIDKILLKIQNGMKVAPYHSDSNSCKLYPAIDIIRVSFTADMFLTYYTTYANQINTWIRRCETKEEVKGIYFGRELPEDLQENLNVVMGAAQEELERLKLQYGL